MFEDIVNGPSIKLKKIHLLVLVFLVLILLAWSAGPTVIKKFFPTKRNWQTTHNYLLNLKDHEVHQFKLHGQQLNLEIVNSSQSRSQGLSSRDQIKADGMLFVFPSPQFYRFWMKDMRFDLDLIWLKSGCITEITPHVSHQNQQKIYQPSQKKVEWVLEVPAGFAKKQGIEPGQCLTPIDF